jgi:predicted nucleic acid-binding protein
MLDANVLYSAIVHPNARMDALMAKATTVHRLVLLDYIVEELLETIQEKAPDKHKEAMRRIASFDCEHIKASSHTQGRLVQIRDEDDYPIIHAAIIEDVDILVTGDRDFLDLGIQRPMILKPADYLDKG